MLANSLRFVHIFVHIAVRNSLSVVRKLDQSAYQVNPLDDEASTPSKDEKPIYAKRWRSPLSLNESRISPSAKLWRGAEK